jgi:hypothetical protein
MIGDRARGQPRSVRSAQPLSRDCPPVFADHAQTRGTLFTFSAMRRSVSLMFKEVLLVVARESAEFTFHTNPNAATIDGKRGTGSQSTDEGRLGRRLPCRRYSTGGHTCKAICLPCAVTSRRAGRGCAARMVQDFSLGRFLDPRQWTIWQIHSRVQDLATRIADSVPVLGSSLPMPSRFTRRW